MYFSHCIFKRNFALSINDQQEMYIHVPSTKALGVKCGELNLSLKDKIESIQMIII